MGMRDCFVLSELKQGVGSPRIPYSAHLKYKVQCFHSIFFLPSKVGKRVYHSLWRSFLLVYALDQEINLSTFANNNASAASVIRKEEIIYSL